MDIRNYRICYFTSQKDLDNREKTLPKTAVVTSDNDGRINNEWILKNQIKLEDGEIFILYHIERIDA